MSPLGRHGTLQIVALHDNRLASKLRAGKQEGKI
jgi:hypothetical protein